MTRLNLILFFVLIFTALGSVTAQHKSRKLYFELQQQQDAAHLADIEWGQLQLEQSTWAMHARIEYIATQQLHMQVPDNKRIQVVMPGSAPVVKSQLPANAGAVNSATTTNTTTNTHTPAANALPKPKPATPASPARPADAPAAARPDADATSTESGASKP